MTDSVTDRAIVCVLVVLLVIGNDPGWLPLSQGLGVLSWVILRRRGGDS